MKKTCSNCKYLSKDGSHLPNDYLKKALAGDKAYHTCKAPGEFNDQWVFALLERAPFKYDMMCAGEDYQPKVNANSTETTNTKNLNNMANNKTTFDLLEEVRMKFNEYQETTSAILDDYVAGNDQMFIELAEADKNFIAEVEKLQLPEGNEALLEKLEEELRDGNIDAEDVLKLLDIDEVKQYCQGSFDICVKVNNDNLRDKLETFIKEEIYPYYSDQEANVLFQ